MKKTTGILDNWILNKDLQRAAQKNYIENEI